MKEWSRVDVDVADAPADGSFVRMILRFGLFFDRPIVLCVMRVTLFVCYVFLFLVLSLRRMILLMFLD